MFTNAVKLTRLLWWLVEGNLWLLKRVCVCTLLATDLTLKAGSSCSSSPESWKSC